MTAAPARRAELAANCAAVRARIAAAATAAGRHPDELTLIAISKTWPASDVRLIASLGITDIGENRDQEAAAKAAELDDLDVTWHFVGRLQTNKCRSVVRYADVVHSVDRPRLVEALAAAAVAAGREVTVLVQVSLDEPGSEPGSGGPEGRGGAAPGDVAALADLVAAADGLRLGGVMAVAPLDADPDPPFARLAEIAAELRRAHPAAAIVSAGMSGDIEAAVRHGATHLRVGTALFGRRAGAVR